MANERNTYSSGGIDFCGLLTIVFIVMKLTGYINWSWWWILSPIWISVIVGIIVVIFLILINIK